MLILRIGFRYEGLDSEHIKKINTLVLFVVINLSNLFASSTYL